MTGTSRTEVAVVGAGLAGAATAWELTRRGRSVTLIERATPAAPGGSSHGSARIFRYAYPDPFYVQLTRRARAGWDELEAAAGQRLVTPADALDFGGLRDVRQLARGLAGAGVSHELLTAAAARERWPQIGFDTDVLWHAGAGVLDAQAAVTAMVGLARAGGATVLTGWPVTSIAADGAGHVVRSAHGDEVRAAAVVVAAGGWLPDLLGALPAAAALQRLVPPLEVRQEQVFHFPYRQAGGGAEAPWPTLIHKSAAIQTYSLPGGRDAGHAGLKVAEYRGGRPIRSAAAADGVVDPANRERVGAYVERYLPGLVPQPYAESTCLFTVTPTEDFVIDAVAGVTVLSACSGHGAKFAPLLGRLAADVATGHPPLPRFALRTPPRR